MAGVAVIAGLAIVGKALWTERPASIGSPETVCAAPVQINDDQGTRVTCAEDLDAHACGFVTAGDSVDVGSHGGCVRKPDGMTGEVRLAVGMALDLNHASQKDLELLGGIGPKLAAAIVHEREKNGAFRSIDELVRVGGLNSATLNRVRPFVAVAR